MTIGELILVRLLTVGDVAAWRLRCGPCLGACDCSDLTPVLPYLCSFPWREQQPGRGQCLAISVLVEVKPVIKASPLVEA